MFVVKCDFILKWTCSEARLWMLIISTHIKMCSSNFTLVLFVFTNKKITCLDIKSLNIRRFCLPKFHFAKAKIKLIYPVIWNILFCRRHEKPPRHTQTCKINKSKQFKKSLKKNRIKTTYLYKLFSNAKDSVAPLTSILFSYT